MTGESPQPERVLESRRLYDGRIMAVRVDTVAMPNGREATREIVEHAPVVAIVPVDENGDVVMVQQYRLATGDVMLEVPAGLVDEGEELEAAAQRELQEEIGHRAGHLERLSGFFVSPGFCTEFIHVFLALGWRRAIWPLTKTKTSWWSGCRWRRPSGWWKRVRYGTRRASWGY